MLKLARRGPASVASSLFSTSICSRCVRVVRAHTVQQSTPRTVSLLAARSFGTSSQWRRAAAASAALEEGAIEGEIEQEVHSQPSPSDHQMKEATKHGPVTKFKDLAERGMVCRTVIDTITKDMGLETMTQVQSMTINETLKGIDV